MQVQAVGVDLEQRDVGERVEADDVGRDLVVVGELDVDWSALWTAVPPPVSASVTTCALVRISPSSEMTKPSPRRLRCRRRRCSASSSAVKIEMIVTTPGAAVA